MKQETTLTGKWLFIGAEKYSELGWQPSDNFVRGMQWKFTSKYFNQTKVIGIITETTLTDPAIEMAYTYNQADKLLEIEIFTDGASGAQDKSEADIYDVDFIENIVFNQPVNPELIIPKNTIIKLSILNLEDSPAPYFRYILQKIE